MPDENASGLILLEKGNTENNAKFDWKNATVYFVLTDRFYNGDPTNDHSYHRQKTECKKSAPFTVVI